MATNMPNSPDTNLPNEVGGPNDPHNNPPHDEHHVNVADGLLATQEHSLTRAPQDEFDAHVGAVAEAHGASVTAIAGSIVLRDAAGKTYIEDATEGLHALNRRSGDTRYAFASHVEQGNAHGASQLATPSSIARRTSGGRIAATTPTQPDHTMIQSQAPVSGTYIGNGSSSRDIQPLDMAGNAFSPMMVIITTGEITGTTTYGVYACLTNATANFALYWGPTTAGGVDQHGQMSNSLRLTATHFRVSANLMNRNGIKYFYIAWPIQPGQTQLT